MPRTSLSADIAAAIGTLAVLTVVLGPALVHLGLFSPLRGLIALIFGIVPCALLAFVFGIVALLSTKSAPERQGRRRAWLGTTTGFVLLLLGGFLLWRDRNTPPIHDLTTNPQSPPAFSESVRAARIRRNGVEYPDGGSSVPAMQQRAYPDLAPIGLPVPPDIALDRARRAAEELGWKITRIDPEEGRLEAYDTSRIFKFVDDIVVRIRPSGAGSVVDVRSSSRVGHGDLGKNAERIREFRRILLSAN